MKPILLALALGALCSCETEAGRQRRIAKMQAATDSLNKEAAEIQGRISLGEYGYLQLGMLQSEALEIMKRPGVEMSASQIGDITSTIYKWEYDNGVNVILMFQDGKLISRAQHGLH